MIPLLYHIYLYLMGYSNSVYVTYLLSSIYILVTIVIITKYFVQLACLVFQTGDLGLSARGPKISKL